MKKPIETKNGIVYPCGSFLAPNGKMFTPQEMKKSINQFKGLNRIHKPMALLFYTDVMNKKLTT